MGTKNDWINAPGHPGVLWREHPDRKFSKRPDRYYAIRYRTGDGKRRMEALGWASEGWTLEMAASALAQIKANIRLGNGPQSLAEKRAALAASRTDEARRAAADAVRNATFGALAEKYLAWAKDARVSAAHVEQLLRMHILPVLGDRPARDITPADIDALRRAVAEKRPLTGRGKNAPGAKLAPQTVLHILKTVREVFNFALETPSEDAPGLMLFEGKNPALLSRRNRALTLPKGDSRRLRVLNDAEIDAILGRTFRGGQDADLRDMILLSLDTGVRAGELVHILRESCDPESGAIRIFKGSRAHDATKGGSSRLVFAGQLFPEALTALRRRLAARTPSPFLFPAADGGPRAADALSRSMRRIADDLGLNDGVADPRNRVVWHTLRHTCATRLLESGVDVYRVKEILGHASVTTTEVYLHLCDRARRERALARQRLAED